MKSCPTCNRTYPDDTLAFCLVDGAVLSAPYEAEQTASQSSHRAPTTEILRAPTADEAPAQSTIVARPPQVPSLSPQAPAASYQEKRSMLPWILFGGAILLVGILGIVVVALVWPGERATIKTTDGGAKVETTPTPKRETLACSRELSPALYDKWIQLDGEKGRLGCPVSDETEAPVSPAGTTGRWVRFAKGDGGYLILHQSGEKSGTAFEVSGCMYKLYADVGGTKSWLGFPLSDGFEITSGARQNFEAGYVTWDSKTYVCEGHKN